MTRLSTGGNVDRDDVRSFTLDGVGYSGFGGDTVASALLAAGRIQVGPSIYRGRPRGILTAGSTEPNALVQVERWPSGAMSEPLVPITTLELVDGLELRTLSGIGRLSPEPDPACYDKKYVHVDVLVVGGGPAGIAAATAAAAAGSRVLLVEERPALSGALEPADELTVLTRASAFGLYDQNYVLVLERRTDHLASVPAEGVSRQRLWHVRAGRVVLATGAHERPLVFADNDRPGIMLAGAVSDYLTRYAVVPGSRAVVATVDDSAYATALALMEAGVPVAAVVDSRPEPPATRVAQLGDLGVPVLTGAVTGTRADADGRLAAVQVDGETWYDADLLAVSGGWSPDLHLWTQARGTTRWDAALSAFVPDAGPPGVEVVGAAAGDSSFEVAPLPVWLTPGLEGEPADWHDHFVDLHRDATVADVARAVGAGMVSLEHVKRYTTIGTGHDQGRTSGLNAAGVVATLTGADVAVLGATGQRAPSHPVMFAALAGREVGHLADPVRTTPMHSWHVASGAVFEDVGQWKRPRFYPRPGESMDDAVLRECAAARSGVAMMDASTLGTIEIVGPDAPEFLNRIYTNAFAKLAVGSARYGLMCTPDGMVMDDGVTMRLAPDRFLMSTTTGNAAKILDWLEEWQQTEWPALRVTFTSVTEQWATAAVVGPRSRDVVGRLIPGLDVSAEGFGFMTFRDATVLLAGAQVPVKVARISFSGELAFEVKVAGWHGLALWEAIFAAGRDFGMTPYGTETMHVLRAEKGYPIIGQDTDGTVTPHDLGMSWIVSKAKDFVGKRSLRRPDAMRPDRRHLVGLLPVDRDELLPEGAQIVAAGVPVTPDDGPVPMLGHVTSSYRSAALGRTFALALVAGGRDRIGETVQAFTGDGTVPVTVVEPVLYDPEGARRDG